MANWISSKLKVAETFLQQIDKQAADSLNNSEKSRSDDERSFDNLSKSGGLVPLKDQLKKKSLTNIGNDYQTKLVKDPNTRLVSENVVGASSNSIDPVASLKSGDWSELLSTPNQSTKNLSSKRSNGESSRLSGFRKDIKKQGKSSMAVPITSSKSYSKDLKLTDNMSENKVIGVFLDRRPSDDEEFNGMKSIQKTSSIGSGSDMKLIDSSNLMVKSPDMVDQEKNRNHDLSSLDKLADKPSTTMVVDESNAKSGSSVSETLKRISSSVIIQEDDSSDSQDSASTSDSESEGEREDRRRKREQFLAEKAALKAVEAIRECENIVAKLEGEKQSLEKILEERAKQQAQEASELQSTMMETMDAVELEKQKHNNTRMEALARLARLETANAELARSLATAQWNLEVEVNQLAELRHQIGQRETAVEAVRRKIFDINSSGTSLNQLMGSKREIFGPDVVEAEYSSVADKLERLQVKAKTLEANIEMTTREIENPTEVEIELKKRLAQLTDHLIQKQTQVEALSSEKATLLFRIEASSRYLEENKTLNNISETRIDIGNKDSKQKHLVGIGRQQLLYQLDAIFSAGVVFLKRNPSAKWWSLLYLVFLHFWVIYILTSHSQISDDLGSGGAVMSLENINNTARN